jgi:SAM-dependent methyltransferase
VDHVESRADGEPTTTDAERDGATVDAADRSTHESTADPTSAPFDAADYWENRLRRSFNFHGVGFRGLGEEFNRLLYAQRLHVVRRMLRRQRIRVEGADVVELGPGSGFYVREWFRQGARSVTGIDITTVATERLTAAYPAGRFITADIGGRWPLPDDSADIVTAFDVLFHVIDDQGFANAIDEASRVLRPAGRFLFTDFFPPDEPFGSGHQRSRTDKAYRAALAHAGLEIAARAPVFIFLHPPVGLPPGRRRDWLAKRWEALSIRVHDNPSQARDIARASYRMDRLLTPFLAAGPTMELIVARKPRRP